MTDEEAPEYVNYRCDPMDPFWLHLPKLRERLAAHGLHVVSAADKAVLEACQCLELDEAPHKLMGAWHVWEAELARREAAK